MRTYPLVSIIIPTYNMRQWIGEAIDSALAQTYPNCEIIVVDDGSTDGTGDYLRERYGDKIRYIYQENRGRGAARNVGFAASRGQYIQFLDADDILTSNKLAEHVNFLEYETGYAAVYGPAQIFPDGSPEKAADRHPVSMYSSGDLLYSEIHTPVLLPIMVLIRREWVDKVGRFDTSLIRREDWDFFLRIALEGGLIAYLAGTPAAKLRTYSFDRESIVATQSGIQVLQKLKRLMNDPGQSRRLELDRALGLAHFAHGRSLHQAGKRWLALNHMLQGIWLDQRKWHVKLLNILMALVLTFDQTERCLATINAVVKGRK